MLPENYLEQLKEQNPSKEELINIEKIHIDTTLPEEKRLEEFIKQIKNPYHFKSGNVSVSIGYKDCDTLKNIVSTYFIETKL